MSLRMARNNNPLDAAAMEELAKHFAGAVHILWGQENDEPDRKKIKPDKHKRYLLLEGRTAKILYAILKLQHAHANQDRMALPRAAQQELVDLLKVDRATVSRTLNS